MQRAHRNATLCKPTETRPTIRAQLVTAFAVLAIAAVFRPAAARAAYTITLQQIGSIVVLSGSGTVIQLPAPSPFITYTVSPRVTTSSSYAGLISAGPSGYQVERYTVDAAPITANDGVFMTGANINTPASWDMDIPGDGLTLLFQNSGTAASPYCTLHEIILPSLNGQTNFDPVLSSEYYLTTLGDLGLREGTYTWTWGGPDASVTLIVAGQPVPEPRTMTLVCVGLLCLLGIGPVRRRLVRP